MECKIITPIPDRTDIALVAESFKKTGNAAEVGVWRGEFAAHNLKYWQGDYFMCDAFCYRPDGGNDKNMADEDSWIGVKVDAITNTAFSKRAFIVQGLSEETASKFQDGFFDWIYIDAGHDYESIAKDLQAWWPKLREGGLFSGDDYGDQSDRWRDKYGHEGQVYKWGVIEAVNLFAQQLDRQVHVTWMNDKTKCPAWYMVK